MSSLENVYCLGCKTRHDKVEIQAIKKMTVRNSIRHQAYGICPKGKKWTKIMKKGDIPEGVPIEDHTETSEEKVEVTDDAPKGEVEVVTPMPVFQKALESVLVEEPVVEEPVVEEPVVEEPVVEEPVVEEPPKVEEPVVEEPPKVEEPVVEKSVEEVVVEESPVEENELNNADKTENNIQNIINMEHNPENMQVLSENFTKNVELFKSLSVTLEEKKTEITTCKKSLEEFKAKGMNVDSALEPLEKQYNEVNEKLNKNISALNTICKTFDSLLESMKD